MLAKIKQTNWAMVGQRAIWTTIWIAAMGITFWLCRGMADKQPVLFALLILCAIGESVGFPYVRRHWMQGNYSSATVACAIAVLCMLVLLSSESAFWSSSIEGTQEIVAREQTIREGHDLVLQKRKERYASLTSSASPEKLQAQIELKQLDPLYARSVSCTDATLPDSRAFCTEFLALKSSLADATEARELEDIVWQTGTREEHSIQRNLYKSAVFADYWLGGGVELWVSIITFLFVLALQALRTGPLYVGYAPEKPPRAQAQPIRKPDTEPQADPKPRVAAHPAPSEKAPEIALQHRPVVQIDVPLKTREDPHRKIAFSKDDLAQFPRLVSSGKPQSKAQEPKPTNEKKREGCVIDWIHDCASTTPDRSAKVASGEAYKESYLQWCRLRNLHPIGQSKFTRKLVAQFKVKERKRDAITGTRYIPGLLLHKPQVELQRKVA